MEWGAGGRWGWNEGGTAGHVRDKAVGAGERGYHKHTLLQWGEVTLDHMHGPHTHTGQHTPHTTRSAHFPDTRAPIITRPTVCHDARP